MTKINCQNILEINGGKLKRNATWQLGLGRVIDGLDWYEEMTGSDAIEFNNANQIAKINGCGPISNLGMETSAWIWERGGPKEVICVVCFYVCSMLRLCFMCMCGGVSVFALCALHYGIYATLFLYFLCVRYVAVFFFLICVHCSTASRVSTLLCSVYNAFPPLVLYLTSLFSVFLHCLHFCYLFVALLLSSCIGCIVCIFVFSF